MFSKVSNYIKNERNCDEKLAEKKEDTYGDIERQRETVSNSIFLNIFIYVIYICYKLFILTYLDNLKTKIRKFLFMKC